MSRPCKLCGAQTEFRFAKTVLFAHRAEYFECVACGSLQVPDTPWLEEAYRVERWPVDTGLVARNLQLAGRIATFLDATSARTDVVIDFGGGTGLLTRLLRDLGWNALCHDRYREPVFVDAFHVREVAGLGARVVIASEVLEHFTTPRESLGELLALAPLIIFTTGLYDRQGEDWWYLAPETGQHVFFFSARALQEVAGAAGFTFADTGLLKFFVREDLLDDASARSRIERAIQQSASVEPGVRALVPYLIDPYRHVAGDFEAELARFRSRASAMGAS